jgi:hypothetical protein
VLGDVGVANGHLQKEPGMEERLDDGTRDARPIRIIRWRELLTRSLFDDL